MSCVVIGVQHHKLAEILLAIFDPRIPKVGAGRGIAVKTMEVRVVLLFPAVPQLLKAMLESDAVFPNSSAILTHLKTGRDHSQPSFFMWDRVI